MKTIIKLWDVPERIKELVHDSDKEDLRLHYEDGFNWDRNSEKEYNEVENQINNFEIKREEYTVYGWCDISGFDYWHNQMNEENYIQISVSFKNDYVKIDSLNQLKEDVEQAYDYFENLV